MSIDDMTPERFNASLRAWAKRNSDKPFHLLFPATSKSVAYRKTTGSNLIKLDDLLAIVANCRPANLPPAEAEEWVRLQSQEWRERLQAAEQSITVGVPAGAVEAGGRPAAPTASILPTPPSPRRSENAQRDMEGSAAHADDGEAFARMGMIHAYVPMADESGVAPDSTNSRRNARKLEVLGNVVGIGGTVRLLAETGNSYLHLRGPFNACVSRLLAAAGRLEVVLMDPAEHLRGDQDELRMKFRQSIRGFMQMEQSYPGQIDLKVLRSRLTATILMTDASVFFEPYLHVEGDERERLLLNTFEMEFDRGSRMYATLAANFDLHQRQAEAATRWLRGS